MKKTSKKNILSIIGIIITVLAIIISGIFYLSHLLATTTHYTYGPYKCSDRLLTIKHDVLYNKLEGVAQTTYFEVNFWEYSFTPLVYPSLFTKAENGVIFESIMNQDQMDQYRNEYTLESRELGIESAHAIAQKYHSGESKYTYDLLSTTQLDSVDFSDFKTCFDTNAESIYTDMILATQDKHLGPSVSQYVLLRKVYNRK